MAQLNDLSYEHQEILSSLFGEISPPLPLPPSGHPSPAPENTTGVPNSLRTPEPLYWENSYVASQSWMLKNNQHGTQNDQDETAPSDHECVEMSVPQCNMEFSSWEEGFKFYETYAEQIGFKVRKGKVQRTSDGMIQKRFFLCSKEGFKSTKRLEKEPKYKRKETRTGCKAEIRLELQNGRWVISSCSLDHNHDLLERPGQKHERGRWVISSCSLDHNHDLLERPGQKHERGRNSNNCQVVSTESTVDGGGTTEHPTSEKVDFPNKNVTKLPLEEVQGLLDRFWQLKAEPSFFDKIELNSENHVTSFFWRDGRSRIDYGYFGDVLALETCTFKNDTVIFASFFGVNHYRLPVLFGCAFLLDNTEASFRWLFRTFMEAMGDRQPKTLYTNDVSEHIGNAVEVEFPEAKHRIALMCIKDNAKKCLPTYFEQPDFEEKFRKCVFYCQTKLEFEEEWNLLMEHYGLGEDPCLATIYKSREKWSPLFTEMTFSGDLESVLAEGDFIFHFHKLNDFTRELTSLPYRFEQCINVAEHWRSIELQKDFSSNGMLALRKGMMKHGAEVYTSSVLIAFEMELTSTLQLEISEIEKVGPGPTSVYKLKEEACRDEQVTFDSASSTVRCSCGKFESTGLLCRHSLKVLNAKNIFRIPEQHILKRWTKSAKEGMVEKESPEINNMPDKYRRMHSRNLMYKALNVITKSVPLQETRKIVEHHLDLALQETDNILKQRRVSTST